MHYFRIPPFLFTFKGAAPGANTPQNMPAIDTSASPKYIMYVYHAGAWQKVQ